MSEPKLISPMLDNFVMGDPISDRNGVRSCPAMDDVTGKKYIVKIISTPASNTQLDAMLLTGAFENKDQAIAYYHDIAQGIMKEINILKKLADLEGFMAFDNHQFVPMDDGNGFDVYLLGTYKMSLAKFFRRETMTHLQALNLGLDMCAALTVCRRLGYIFVNLKPENIYLTTDNGFRIGDLGFIKLDSLKFATLPDRYRSAYTAPELNDPFALLNESMDVYAAGAILYQAFSGGQMPVFNEDGTVAPPDFADYEMAEIIMKACDPNPENRWEDPAQMGHALVDYMQRNGAHDTPIVPPVLPEPNPIPTAEEEPAAAEEEIVEEAVAEETTTEEVAAEEAPAVVEEFVDETLPGMDEEDMEIGEVTDEVSEMLQQADALLAHEIPEPVVAPEPIEVELPEEPVTIEEPAVDVSADETRAFAPIEDKDEDAPHKETAEQKQVEESASADVIEEESAETEPEADDAEEVETEKKGKKKKAKKEKVKKEKAIKEKPEEETSEEEKPEKKKSKKGWLAIPIILLIILGLLAGGYYFYKYYYVQTISSITCESDGTLLSVVLDTEASDDILTVVCADTYGNKLRAAVVNGVATFNDLTPDSPYTITVEVSGFHTLTGETSVAYATPQLTIVKDFKAYTGTANGSVVLCFTVEGPDTKWNISYAAENGAEMIVVGDDHMVTIEGLTVGNAYEFKLYPADEEFNYTGETVVQYTAVNTVLAQDLYTSCVVDGVLNVYWTAPKNAVDVTWTVRCYNEDGYDERIPSTTETNAAFENISEDGEYTIEVTADGMLTGMSITIDTTATKITNAAITIEDDAAVLTWECDAEFSDDWYVEYTIDGNIKDRIDGGRDCSIELPALIPGARYKFVIGNGETEFIGNVHVHTTSGPETFNNFGVKPETVKLQLCKLPESQYWNIATLEEGALTNAFMAGESAGLAITIDGECERSWTKVTVRIMIHDDMGQIMAMTVEEIAWNSLWSEGEANLALPELPNIMGTYSAVIYIDNALFGQVPFTVSK